MHADSLKAGLEKIQVFYQRQASVTANKDIDRLLKRYDQQNTSVNLLDPYNVTCERITPLELCQRCFLSTRIPTYFFQDFVNENLRWENSAYDILLKTKTELRDLYLKSDADYSKEDATKKLGNLYLELGMADILCLLAEKLPAAFETEMLACLAYWVMASFLVLGDFIGIYCRFRDIQRKMADMSVVSVQKHFKAKLRTKQLKKQGEDNPKKKFIPKCSDSDRYPEKNFILKHLNKDRNPEKNVNLKRLDKDRGPEEDVILKCSDKVGYPFSYDGNKTLSQPCAVHTAEGKISRHCTSQNEAKHYLGQECEQGCQKRVSKKDQCEITSNNTSFTSKETDNSSPESRGPDENNRREHHSTPSAPPPTDHSIPKHDPLANIQNSLIPQTLGSTLGDVDPLKSIEQPSFQHDGDLTQHYVQIPASDHFDESRHGYQGHLKSLHWTLQRPGSLRPMPAGLYDPIHHSAPVGGRIHRSTRQSMQERVYRTASMLHLMSNLAENVSTLAEAGLYFDAEKDKMCCYRCRWTVPKDQFLQLEDPLNAHSCSQFPDEEEEGSADDPE